MSHARVLMSSSTAANGAPGAHASTLKDLIHKLSRSPREDDWQGHIQALDALRAAAAAALPAPEHLRALAPPFLALLSCERSALVGAAADTLLALAAAPHSSGSLAALATEALYMRVLENAGAGNRVNARHNAALALQLCERGVGCAGAWTGLLRTALRGEEGGSSGGGGGGGSGSGSSGGGSASSAGATGSTCAAGTRELAQRLLNVMLGSWPSDALARATGLSGLAGTSGGTSQQQQQHLHAAAAALLRGGCPRGEIEAAPALLALLTLGLTDGSQALRKLGRVNFRLAAARLPALAEATRAFNARMNARQLASVATEESADALALGEAGAEVLLLVVEGVGIRYAAPPAAAEAAAAQAAAPVLAAAPLQTASAGASELPRAAAKRQPAQPSAPSQQQQQQQLQPQQQQPQLPAPQQAPDAAAALLELASHMKGTLASLMASMQPQLQLLSQLDRRMREANLAAVERAGERGPQGSLSMANEVLARAACGTGSGGSSAGAGGAAPLSGAVLAGGEGAQGELEETAASFRAWVGAVDASLGSLREVLDRVQGV